MIHPLGRTTAGNAQASARIKTWVREALTLADDVSVMVTELRCAEDGCPPLETCIAVMATGGPRLFKVSKAMAEISREDVTRCIRPGDDHPDTRTVRAQQTEEKMT